MTFEQFVFWAFCALLTGGLALVVQFLAEIKTTFKEIRDELKELNTKVVVVVTRTDNHETRIIRLEEKF